MRTGRLASLVVMTGVLLAWTAAARGQDPAPKAPVLVIVGHTTHDAVKLNLTTTAPQKGELAIDTDGPANAVAAIVDRVATYETTAASGHRAIVSFRGLRPRTPYRIKAMGKVVARFRTMPRPGEAAPLRIGFGSCLMAQAKQIAAMQPDGQRKIIENFRILPHLAKEELDAFLWIGDRFYAPGVWEQYDNATEAEVRRVFWQLHDLTVGLPDVRTLLGRTPNYVIWDDHDFGPNDSSGHFKFKQVAMDALVQGFANPDMGEKENPGCYFKLTLGALDLFLLDDRWHRGCAGRKVAGPGGVQMHACTPEVKQRGDGTYVATTPLDEIHGKRQMEWLRTGLAASKATFKLVISGNQMLSDIHRFESWYHSTEREAFLAWLREAKVPGVVFVSGDRHHCEVGVLKTGGPYPLYEITSSGLGANVYPLDTDTPQSPYDVVVGKGSVENYGLIEFDPKDGGTLTLILEGPDGKEIGRQALRSAALTAGK